MTKFSLSTLRLSRRKVLATVLAASASAVALAPPSLFAAPTEVRIGYQKNGVLYLAKETGQLEAALKAKGLSVKWVEFSFGPPLLEALGAGSIDYGTTGDSPPIFAQAAGANLVYVAAQEAAGSGAAILVKDGSNINALSDLKGKKVGFAKASSSHNLTIAALEKAGLTYKDVEPVYLAPADGAAAFAKGAIDAWTIWDPFFAVAEAQPGTKVLAPAKGIVTQNSFFLANADFAKANPEIISAVNEGLAATARWAETHRKDVTAVFSKATGIAADIQQKAVDRTEFVIHPLRDPVIAEQQRIADRFLSLGLIPKQIAVKDIVWTWKPAS
jgi:NitT/TauT family transport system substrate-binding protein/sulfonate transport system substrate-binding protein